MYSRYAGYQPFVPMNNRLSRFRGEPSDTTEPEYATEPRDLPPHHAATGAASADISAAAPGLEQLLAGLAGGGGAGLLGSSGKGLAGLGKSLLGGGGKGLLGGAKGLLGGGKGLLGGLLGKDAGIGSLLKGLRLDWDASDILLVLILLFLSLDGDDDEILWIIAIALVTGF